MKQTTTLSFFVWLGLLAGILLASSASAEEWVQGAPSGDPKQVAINALGTAKKSCGTVVSAKRYKDGVIDAACSSGARFLVFTLKGETMTKRCLPAKTMGIHDC